MEIKRDTYLNKLISARHNGMIKVLTGVRRCGKSYMLSHRYHDYLKSQGPTDDHIIKVDLEDRKNKALREPDALLAYIDSKDDTALKELIDIVASSIGGLTNPTKLSNTFKSVSKTSISHNTIISYLDILQDVFLLEKSIRYDIKGKKYIETPAKYYFEDLGLRNSRLGFRQYEVTHLMENLIYNELRIRGLIVDVGVVVLNTKDETGKSLRKQLEVDFVCNQSSKRIYMQSAFSLPDDEKREQELKSLMNMDDSFLKVVITADPIKRYQNHDGIVFLNIFDFLLNPDSLTL